jgi:DNA-binding response OmpR family regulator
MRLLLLEDDPVLGNGIQVGLQQAQYVIDWLQDGQVGRHALHYEEYDGLILDLGLPHKDGLTLLRELRTEGQRIPVLILTARDTIEDRVYGLDCGADDYMIKPFALQELLARLRALLRRSQGRANSIIEHGHLMLDPHSHTLTQNGQPVTLSPKAFMILQILLESAGRILSRRQLEDKLYSWDQGVESNALEVHIHHIRKKLGKEIIRTVRGVGYTVTLN